MSAIQTRIGPECTFHDLPKDVVSPSTQFSFLAGCPVLILWKSIMRCGRNFTEIFILHDRLAKHLISMREMSQKEQGQDKQCIDSLHKRKL
jgi:hypothetical protein